MTTIRAPWTSEQVASLERFQMEGGMHPFTCGGNQHSMAPRLVPSRSGWHCPDPDCSYTQDWAHAFMADPTQWSVSPFGVRHGPTPKEVRDWIAVPDREMEQLQADLKHVQERACSSAESLRNVKGRLVKAEAAIERVRAELDRWGLNTLMPQTMRALDDIRAALDRNELPKATEFP